MPIKSMPGHARLSIDELVKEAIKRELARGGQVYYVYNRVATIAEAAAALQELVPEATVAFAHGRMKEDQLSRLMYGLKKRQSSRRSVRSVKREARNVTKRCVAGWKPRVS